MRLIVALGLITLVACSCAPTSNYGFSPEYVRRPDDALHEGQSPCVDSLYLALGSEPLDDMSEREYEYFIQKDAACAEYQRAEMLTRKTQQTSTKARETAERAINAYITLGLVALFVSGVLIFTL